MKQTILGASGIIGTELAKALRDSLQLTFGWLAGILRKYTVKMN